MNNTLLFAMIMVIGIFLVQIDGLMNSFYVLCVALGCLQIGAEWQRRESLRG